MVRIELAPEVLNEIERFIDHLEPHEVANVAERVGEILEGIQILARSPLIGLAGIETVFILAMRAQRESGFKH